MKWILILMLGTGQHVGLHQQDEAACRAAMKLVEAGIYKILTLDNGVILPVLKAIECVSEAEFNSRKGNGA